MTRALFVTFDAGGNVPPMIGIAQRLVTDGGGALVLGSPATQDAAEQAGVEFQAFSVDQPYATTRPLNLVSNLSQVTATAASRAIAADVAATIARRQPDVVVVDCMLFSAIRAAVRSGRRTVTLVHTLPSFYAGPYAHGPVGVVMGLRGLRPSRVWASAHSSIATVTSEFDPGATTTPFAGLRLVGPVAPAGSEPAPPAVVDRDRPRLLVSLSTIWFPNQDRTLAAVLAAIGELDVDAVVTTGRALDPADFRPPANVTLHRLLDHDSLLGEVDLVVGHGGHGTTLRALSRGVPVLVLPSFSFSDQPLVGRRVAELGVGRTLPSTSKPDVLRQAIAELARPGPHRDAAAAFASRIRSADPAGDAVAHLTAVR